MGKARRVSSSWREWRQYSVKTGTGREWAIWAEKRYWFFQVIEQKQDWESRTTCWFWSPECEATKSGIACVVVLLSSFNVYFYHLNPFISPWVPVNCHPVHYTSRPYCKTKSLITFLDWSIHWQLFYFWKGRQLVIRCRKIRKYHFSWNALMPFQWAPPPCRTRGSLFTHLPQGLSLRISTEKVKWNNWNNFLPQK